MSGKHSVIRYDRPVVVEYRNIGCSEIDHRFDGERHALIQARTSAGTAVIGNFGILMQM